MQAKLPDDEHEMINSLSISDSNLQLGSHLEVNFIMTQFRLFWRSIEANQLRKKYYFNTYLILRRFRLFWNRIDRERFGKTKKHEYYIKNKKLILSQTNKWRSEHKDKTNQVSRSWYHKNKIRIQAYRNNPDIKIRRQLIIKQWKLRHKDLVKEQNHKSYLKNKETVLNRGKEWTKAHPERSKEIARFSMMKKRRERRFQLIQHYSNGTMRCALCYENIYDLLTIDHIDGGGNKHRRTFGSNSGDAIYIWLIKNHYPEGFQILCFTCNWLKSHISKQKFEQILELRTKKNLDRINITKGELV